MNKSLYIGIGAGLVVAFTFFGAVASSRAQELPGGMTKEEFCAMRASGAMPRPQGTPPQGAGFPGGGTPPPGGMPSEGMQRPAGRTMPDINCDDLETVVSPSAASSVSTKRVYPAAPEIPASATATLPRMEPATQQGIQTESYGGDTSGNLFFGSDSTFSNNGREIKADEGFFAFVVAKISSVFKGLFSRF